MVSPLELVSRSYASVHAFMTVRLEMRVAASFLRHSHFQQTALASFTSFVVKLCHYPKTSGVIYYTGNRN
jgi:hypothetical protein